MKKLFLVLALVALMAVPASAQMKMDFGIKGGVNLAKLTGDVENTKMLLGGGGGAFARFNLAEGQFTIQPEVLFMMKGTKMKDVDDYKFKANYIDVPVLLKYNIQTEGNFAPSIFAGPYVGLLMTAKEMDVDVKDSLKTTDFGLVFGAGFDYTVGTKGKLTFDARYGLGLSNINDTADADAYKIKNAVISVMVGYAFKMGE